MKQEWIKIEDREPEINQEIIAVGTWYGEVTGIVDDNFICVGIWSNNAVVINTDIYHTDIINVTHWMPVPELPN